MTSRLYIAISDEARPEFERIFDERTAGAWRGCVSLVGLYPARADKVSNDGWIEFYANRDEVEAVYAAHDLTSTRVGQLQKVLRLTKAELIAKTNHWFRVNGLDWRSALDTARSRGPYRWTDPKVWIDQFSRIDPIRGRKLATGLLLQLRIVSVKEVSDYLDVPEPADHHVFFVGSDPHSGDHGLINTLAALLPGTKLSDAQAIPELPPNASLRLFSDAGWSGGESVRRLGCLYRRCEKKTWHASPSNKVYLRFAFLTDLAEKRLVDAIAELHSNGVVGKSVHISSPSENRMSVSGEHGTREGLAFQNRHINLYVDPVNENSVRDICKSIGIQLSKQRPLGTKNIASTIGFEHSLPRAMLPVFIMEDIEVTSHDGQVFRWHALIRSKHLSDPGLDDKRRYCGECPLSD